MFYYALNIDPKGEEKMKIAIAADHGGFELKQHLIAKLEAAKHQMLDMGTTCNASCDYPEVVKPVVRDVLAKKVDFGILICGTGIGISIAANRYKGIRATLLYSDFVAEMAKKHNNANILVFGGRTMELEDVLKRIDIFMSNDFEAGRHANRIDKLDEGEI